MDTRVTPVLLLVGKDKLLLQTRRALLRTVGIAAILAENTTEACAAARYLRLQAVLLCHTLTEPEQNQIIDGFRHLQAKMPILRLAATNVEPRHLIAIVQQTVGQQVLHPPLPPQRGEGRRQREDGDLP